VTLTWSRQNRRNSRRRRPCCVVRRAHPMALRNAIAPNPLHQKHFASLARTSPFQGKIRLEDFPSEPLLPTLSALPSSHGGAANRRFTHMTGRRLTDRIRELCAKALDHHQADWNATLNELQFAIQEHTLRLSNMSVAASVPGQVIEDRRKPEPPIPHSVRTLVQMHSAVHANRKAHGKKSRMSSMSSTAHYSRP